MGKRSINISGILWDEIKKDMEKTGQETVSEWLRDAIREKLKMR